VRWSQTYIPTLRESPAEAELASHRYLLRAGYIRKLAAGVYNYLPLMQRVLLNVTRVVREEMDRSGALEVLLPVLQPTELWERTGRHQVVGKELMRLKDRHQRDLVLGGTHEEVVTHLVAGELKSYRQLPLNLYQIQVKFRDEIRPRFGLLRGREFYMKDAYSFDADEAGLVVAYEKMVRAYFAAFRRMGLNVDQVESDTGAMGGQRAHEFMLRVSTEGGEADILSCPSCGYAANLEKAEAGTGSDAVQGSSPLEIVDTPGARTVEEVTACLGVGPDRLIKTLIYMADGVPVVALVRGDRELNEVKLKNALHAVELELAESAVIERVTGAPVGFAGPVGLSKVRILADFELAGVSDGVTGANRADAHYTGVQYGRDYTAESLLDLRNAVAGDLCTRCRKGRLEQFKGIEVGNTFMLGTKYSAALGAVFLDEAGKERPCVMGSYGIGITRTAQAAVEAFHDEAGILWPWALAPYHIQLLPLNVRNAELVSMAERMYSELQDAGFEVLLDDRDERGGVKFKDADLVGVPVQVILGERGLASGQAEVKVRRSGQRQEVPLSGLTSHLKALASELASPAGS